MKMVQNAASKKTILIQHKSNGFKCGLTQEAFDHVSLYVCVTLPMNPTGDPHQIPLAIVGTFLMQHYSLIPTMCGFSRAVCSLPGPWRIPLRRGDQLLVIATRRHCVRVETAEVVCKQRASSVPPSPQVRANTDTDRQFSYVWFPLLRFDIWRGLSEEVRQSTVEGLLLWSCTWLDDQY